LAKLTCHKGNALSTTLRPIGGIIERTVTGPLGALGGAARGAIGPVLGHKEERMEILGGENKENEENVR